MSLNVDQVPSFSFSSETTAPGFSFGIPNKSTKTGPTVSPSWGSGFSTDQSRQKSISATNLDCKCQLKYKELTSIDMSLLSQIKMAFIFGESDATDIIFVTNIDEVYVFGANNSGRLGLGHNSSVKKPTILKELSGKNLIDIKCGQSFMIGRTEFGQIYTWGYGSGAQLGQFGTNSSGYFGPKEINLNNELVSDVRCCDNRTYLLTQSEQIFWFENRYNMASNYSPTQIKTFKNLEITQISCGRNHTLALTVNGKVFSWGSNTNGCLGLGQQKNIETPVEVPIDSTKVFIKQISCGYNHSLLLSSNGHIYSFGDNSCGQLGTEDNVHRSQPKSLSTLHIFEEIFAAKNMSFGRTSFQQMFIWGQTKQGNRNIPFETKAKSFQEAIDEYSSITFTYKPLSLAQMFEKKASNRVIQTMSKAFNDPNNSDLKFKFKREQSEDQFDYIYCHKWFIENSSEHFQTWSQNDKWSENEINVIEIAGYSYEAYYHFIRYLYTDNIETEDIEILLELLSISDTYLDEMLKTKCVKQIKPLINDSNVCSLYSCSIKYRSQDLEEYCFELMSKHLKTVFGSEDFEKMDSNYAKHFLSIYSQRK